MSWSLMRVQRLRCGVILQQRSFFVKDLPTFFTQNQWVKYNSMLHRRIFHLSSYSQYSWLEVADLFLFFTVVVSWKRLSSRRKVF